EYQKRFRDAREEWLDQGHGGCILRHSQIAATVADSLRHFDGVRYALDSFVVMPNHVHVLVQPHEDNALSEILHSWKSFSAKAINKFRERPGIVWQDENYDRMVRDFEELERYRDYIKENPVAAKLDEGEFILELWEDAAGETPARPADRMSAPLLLRAKKLGFSDRQLAIAGGVPEKAIRSQRIAQNITPTYRLVDTCAAEFEAYTPYYYSTYGSENVLNIYDQEKPEGVVVHFGGQTPLKLADGLKAAGVPILGTQPESIEMAEDRQLFAVMLDKLGLRQTPNGSAVSMEEAVAIANRIGYPVLVRPSFVLGGRGMELVYNETDLRKYVSAAISDRNTDLQSVRPAELHPAEEKTAEKISAEHTGRSPVFRPILIDRFLEDAMEVDVDCISDGETTVIGAIMEHIEQAGIHSGDSACVIPTFSLTKTVLAEISSATKAMARELNVRGLMNVQFAVK